MTPATVTWKNAAGGAWEVPGNWDTGALPRAGDDVVIPDLPGDVTITHATGTDTIRSLTSHEGVVLSGGSLIIGASGATSAINGSFTVSGGLVEFKSTAAINGPFTIAARSTLRVLGSNAGDAALTVANGFTNNGAIELTSVDASKNATLTVSSGTLVNAPRASLSALPGAGGSRTLSAQLDNRNEGLLSVAQDLLITNTDRTLSNFGTFAITEGRTLNVSGGSLTNLNGGTLTGGTYQVAGTFKFPNAAITTNAATIVLDGPNARIVNVNQADADALTNFATNVGNFTLRNGRSFTTAGAFSNPGSLTIEAGSTFKVTRNLTNFAFAERTLRGGSYFVSGTFQFLDADVQTNAATLVLDSAASRIVNLDNEDGLANFATNTAVGHFTIQNGRNFTTPTARDFTNNGSLTIGSGSSFTVTRALANFMGTTLRGGDYFVSGTFKFPSADIQTLAANLVLDGRASAIVNQLDANALANLTNIQANNSFTIQNGRNVSTAAAAFSNAGTLIIGAGTTFRVDRTFTNLVDPYTLRGGTYEVAGRFEFPGADIRTLEATLVLNGPGSGIFNSNQNDADALANLAMNTGSFTIRNGRTFFAAAPFTNASTVTIERGSMLTAVRSYTQTAGLLTGAGDLTVLGLLTWSGGIMSGSGQTRANGGMILNGSARQYLNERTLINASDAIVTGPVTGILVAENGAILHNLPGASIDFQTGYGFNTSVYGPSPTFRNEGTLRKSGTGSTQIPILVINTGTVEVLAGTLYLAGVGASSGGFTVAAGATLQLGNASLSTGSSISGAGTVELYNRANVAGTYNVTGSTMVTYESVRFTGPVLSVGSSLTINNASADFGTNNIRTGTLSLGAGFGSLSGSGTLTVTGLLTWTSGYLDFRQTLANGRLELSGDASKYLYQGSLTNAGTATWTGRGDLVLNNSVWTNLAGATFDAQNDANIRGAGAFTNEGTFRKSAGTGTTTIGAGFTAPFGEGIAFTNTGIVQVQTGTLSVAAGLTIREFVNRGSVTIGNGSTFAVPSPYTQAAGSTILRGGTLRVSSGTGTVEVLREGVVAGFGTIDAHLVNRGQVNPGETNATGLLTVTGNYTQSSTGTLNIEIGSLNGNQYDRLQISGTATLEDRPRLRVTLLNSFSAREGDLYEVLTFSSLSGRFAEELPTLIAPLSLDPKYENTRLLLQTSRR